jgi:hypothetical protein
MANQVAKLARRFGAGPSGFLAEEDGQGMKLAAQVVDSGKDLRILTPGGPALISHEDQDRKAEAEGMVQLPLGVRASTIASGSETGNSLDLPSDHSDNDVGSLDLAQAAGYRLPALGQHGPSQLGHHFADHPDMVFEICARRCDVDPQLRSPPLIPGFSESAGV